MKSLTDDLQLLIDADAGFPVTTARITLVDAESASVLHVADQHVYIDGDEYLPDLMHPPSLVIDGTKGIDNISIVLNNGDWAYSAFDNASDFDGARVVVNQYFGTDNDYAILLGPVLSFTGIVSEARTGGDGEIVLTVLADTRLGQGTIGRTITGRCLHVFRDANCGYTHSAVIETGGTYAADALVPVVGPGVNGQVGPGAIPLYNSTNPIDRVKITRAGADIAGTVGSADPDPITVASNFLFTEEVRFNRELTLQAGDKIEYISCPRDSMFSCTRRWQFGSATRQQDNWMGFDYLRVFDRPDLISAARYEDIIGAVIPIMYGSRWIDPVLMLAHQDRHPDSTAAWNSDQGGPFVFALISEGPVDTGITDPLSNIELDGVLAKDHPEAFDNGLDDVEIIVGGPSEAPNDFAPQANRVATRAPYHIPALPSFRHVAYVGVDLPNNYELIASSPINEQPQTWAYGEGPIQEATRFFWARQHSLQRPNLRFKAKGRTVYTWSMVGEVPTKSGARVYSTNPVWQLLDLLTSPFRVAESDAWSADVDENDLLESMPEAILWAAYCDETVVARDVGDNDVNVSRYTSSLYITNQSREEAVQALLDAMRASIVFRRGVPGIVIDAPLGGKGLATAATATTLTDARRSSVTDEDLEVPSWPVDLLTGLRIKILDGTGVDQVRTIASNTKDEVTITEEWDTNPDSTSEYAIYAVELTQDHIENIVRNRDKPGFSVLNKAVVEFEAEDYRGQRATISIPDDNEDESGQTLIDKFGVNEQVFNLSATTSWQQAVRHGWYKLRKEIDTNRIFVLHNVNVVAVPIEVGDILLVSHDVDGLSNETLRVERIQGPPAGPFEITCRLYREHIYADWPTALFDGLDISSTLINPHGVPPNVGSLTYRLVDDGGATPVIIFSYVLPQWPYAGWHVILEMQNQDADAVWSEYETVATSKTATISFRGNVSVTRFRVVFVSHAGIRSDAAHFTGTSSGSNTSTTLNDTAKEWSVDTLVGLTASITAGLGAEQEREITSNEATELTIDPAWSATPDATSDYIVYDPAPTVLFGTAIPASQPFLRSLTISELIRAEGRRSVTAVTVGPGVTGWLSYEKDGAWPTMDGLVDGIPDPTYYRGFHPSTELSYERTIPDSTNRRVIAFPMIGTTIGVRLSAQMTSGAGVPGSEPGAIYEPSAVATVGGVIVACFINETLEVDDSDYEIDVYIGTGAVASGLAPRTSSYRFSYTDTNLILCDSCASPQFWNFSYRIVLRHVPATFPDQELQVAVGAVFDEDLSVW